MKQISLADVARDIEQDPLRKAFVLTALESYCRSVIADTSDWGNSLVNKDAWVAIAKENLTMLGYDENGNRVNE